MSSNNSKVKLVKKVSKSCDILKNSVQSCTTNCDKVTYNNSMLLQTHFGSEATHETSQPFILSDYACGWIFLIYSTESPVPIAARNTVKQGISNVWTATTDTVSTWLNGGPRSVAKNGASIASTAPNQASQVPSATPSQAVDATPALSIVQGHQLRSVYYYHFDDDLPQSEHDVFLKAVKVYNTTGIVKLVAGPGKKSDNQITFPSYKKEMSAESFGSTELGAGGRQLLSKSMAAKSPSSATPTPA